MPKSEEAAKLRMRARVCRDLAKAAPTETERKYWLELATESDEQAISISAMRDFIIVAVLCLLWAFVTDRLWLDGKYSDNLTTEWLLDFSSMRRH
jgi:hypothetical protein